MHLLHRHKARSSGRERGTRWGSCSHADRCPCYSQPPCEYPHSPHPFASGTSTAPCIPDPKETGYLGGRPLPVEPCCSLSPCLSESCPRPGSEAAAPFSTHRATGLRSSSLLTQVSGKPEKGVPCRSPRPQRGARLCRNTPEVSDLP